MSRQVSGDMSVYSVGGVDLMDYFHDTSLEITADTVEGRSLAYLGRSARGVKKGGQIQTSLMSSSGNSCQSRVSNLNVTALAIDGTAYATMLRGGTFRGEYTIVEASAVGDFWKYPYGIAKDYTADVDLMLPLSATANAARTIAVDVCSSDPEDLCMVFSVTINSVAYTLPMMITKMTHKWSDNDLAMFSVSLKGKGPDSDSGYPTAPTGTTTLLEKAFNDPFTALSYTITPYAAVGKGESYTGNCVFGGFSFSFNDASLIMLDYTFLTQGAVTHSTT